MTDDEDEAVGLWLSSYSLLARRMTPDYREESACGICKSPSSSPYTPCGMYIVVAGLILSSMRI